MNFTIAGFRFSWFYRITAVVALALAGCSAAPVKPAKLAPGDYRYVEDYLRWYIPKQLKKYDVPGLSIALVEGQTLRFAQGFGYADRERRIPATADTVYQVGSISKVITAAAVMQLVAQGKMNLDRPIQQYLPDFSMRSRWNGSVPITMRAILSHHAGLPTYYLKGFFSSQPLEELLALLKTEYLVHPPATVFQYSNLSSDLAGLSIERVTGTPFSSYVQAALLQPLNMENSSFTLNERIADKLARGYVKGRPASLVPVRDVPAGSLLSNALDLSRFMQFIFAGGKAGGRQVLPQNDVAAMFAPQYADAPLDFGQHYGLGWMLSGITIPGGGLAAWHNGGTKTFLSQMLLLPEQKLGVVVLTNADSAKDLIYDVSETALKLALEARGGMAPAPPPAPRLAPPSIKTAALRRYAGDYSLMGTLAKVSFDGELLQLHVLDHTLTLVPTSETAFRAEIRLLKFISIPIPFPPIEFTRVDNRDFLLIRDRVVIAAEKIPPYEIPATWRERIGDYRITNPDSEYLVNLDRCRLLIEDGRLLLDIKISGLDDRQVKVVLMPLSGDEAYVFGLGRNVGDTTRADHRQGRVRLWYSGYLFERQAG